VKCQLKPGVLLAGVADRNAWLVLMLRTNINIHAANVCGDAGEEYVGLKHLLHQTCFLAVST